MSEQPPPTTEPGAGCIIDFAPPSASDQNSALPASIKPLNIWSPSQFIGHAFDPAASLLGDFIIEKGEWTSLVGVGGIGKSRITLWLAICMILKRPWCGLETRGGPHKVLFLCTENGVRRWQEDLKKMTAPLAPAALATVETNLRIMALTADEDGDLCLGNLESVARLKATLRAELPAFIVLDPFANMIAGDENKTVDVVATLRTLREIHRHTVPDAAVLIIHHSRTGALNVLQAGDNYSAGNFARGSKALFSRVRAEIQLAPGARDDDTKIVLACGKANNGAKFQTLGIAFDPVTYAYEVDSDFNCDEWRADVAGKIRRQTLSVADVVEAVQTLGPLPGEAVTTGAICASLKNKASERTIKSRIAEALKAGYLDHAGARGSYLLGSNSVP